MYMTESVDSDKIVRIYRYKLACAILLRRLYTRSRFQVLPFYTRESTLVTSCLHSCSEMGLR